MSVEDNYLLVEWHHQERSEPWLASKCDGVEVRKKWRGEAFKRRCGEQCRQMVG